MEQSLPGQIDLSECTEDDVVEMFRRGLESFIERCGGAVSSRRVTLRQEKTYPSDQDYALVLTTPQGFRLHILGLQFKRVSSSWRKDEHFWLVDPNQREVLRGSAHVVAYCLPRPCHIFPSHSLHGFYFVHPGCLSTDATRIRLDWFLHHKHTGDNWAHLQLRWKALRPDSGDEVPRLSWGEFFDAVEEGALHFTVPGTPQNPSPPEADPQGPPGLNRRGTGLTITCSGSWGSAWARHQITQHLHHWSATVLSPPAAVIAYESFSRTLEFIELRP